MGHKHIPFYYDDLENLSDNQLIRRFQVESFYSTYSKYLNQGHKDKRYEYNNSDIFYDVCLDICEEYLTYHNKLTRKQRNCLINFQYYHDRDSMRGAYHHHHHYGTFPTCKDTYDYNCYDNNYW